VNFDVVLLSRRLAAALLLGFVLAVPGRGARTVGSHVPGSGWATTLTMVAAGSVLFVGLYWLRRNLPLCVGAHAVTNLLILADTANAQGAASSADAFYEARRAGSRVLRPGRRP
jgi:hypothetical protein